MNNKVTEPQTPEEEIEILYPDRTVQVGGTEVTVREFRALEGMKLAELWRPIVDALREISEDEALHGAEPGWEFLDSLVGRHSESVLQLLEINTGQPRAWIEELPETEFLELLAAFWRANQGFFMRRLVRALRPVPAAATGSAREH